METCISIGRQKIQFDREATCELYRSTITVPGADSCGCLACRNFAEQRQSTFPKEFKTLLVRIGIDPFKEWEAFEFDQGIAESKRRVYGGWFLFCGELVEGKDMHALDLPFSFCFSTSFPNATLPHALKTCAVEFYVEIPWVLPEAPE